jgi:membrane associated rhomboid family serine protease
MSNYIFLYFHPILVTPHTNLVGASGGDFCLITAVIANCMLNGDSMNCAMAILRVSLMTVYCGMEVYFSIQRYMNHENSVSWAAHLGGAVTGLLLGTMVLRNLNKKVRLNK